MVDNTEEVFLEGKVEKKSNKKKKKSKEGDSEDASVAVPNTLEDGVKLSKEGKRKKEKNDLEVSNDVDIGKKDDDEVVNHQKENSKRKKKKRKLEHPDDSDKIQVEEEERLCLQTDEIYDLGNDREVKTKNKEKKKKRHEEDKDTDKHEIIHEQRSSGEGNVAVEIREKDQDLCDSKGKKKTAEEVGEVADNNNADVAEKVEKRKRKKENKKAKDVSCAGGQETLAEDLGNKTTDLADDVETKNNADAAEKVEKRKRKKENKKAKDVPCAGGEETLAQDLGNESTKNDVAENVEKRKRKKENKKAKDVSCDGGQGTELGNEKHGVEAKKGKKRKSAATNSSDPKTKKKSKKVTFSSEVEVFPVSEGASKRKRKKVEEDGLVRGKRFTPEEDERIKESVMNYIKVHGLGEQGLQMILNCKAHKELKNCWKDIAAALPERPYSAVYYRAHCLYERGENHKWTPEEVALVRKCGEEGGRRWKEVAIELGKSRVHVKDLWRRIRREKLRKGSWSQDEYQTLFDLVNTDLRMKIFEEKKSKHGMLRDNISWTAISEKLETRTDPLCCVKWYDNLTSPMVKKKIWADIDDYRMLIALYELDACCIEDVDWETLLDYRPGELCRNRWDEMYNHIGEHGCKSFADQVEVLLKRYCPDVLEAREIWDSKPRVP